VLCLRGYNAGITSSDLLLRTKLVIYTPSNDPNSPAALELPDLPNLPEPMATLTTPPGLIPNGARTIKIKLEGNIVGSADGNDRQYFYFDNITTRGNAKAARDLGSTISVQLPYAQYSFEKRQPTADPDGDGIPNLLEYAFGSDAAKPSRFVTLPNGNVNSVTPIITSVADGFVTLKFRIISGPLDTSTFVDGYLTVNDLLYVPQSSDDALNWLAFGKFNLSGPVVDNEDGTQTVTIISRNRLISSPSFPTVTPRYFFRVRVENIRDPWMNPPGSECPFPE
jgi:hypothetical protein